jgi:two-component system OmpR family response regulator
MTTLQRVLHVEDDPSIRMVTSVALEKVGNLEVLSCEGGEQAMAKAVAFDPQDRLALFRTAKVQQKEIEEYLGLGALAVIIKPFDPMTLAHQIEEHWVSFQQRRAG